MIIYLFASFLTFCVNVIEFFFYIADKHELLASLVWGFVLLAQFSALFFGAQLFQKMKECGIKELPTRTKFLPRSFFSLLSRKYHIGVRIRGGVAAVSLIFCLLIWQIEGLVLLGNEYQDGVQMGYSPEYLLYLITMSLGSSFK